MRPMENAHLIISTERLLLRLWTADDVAPFQLLSSDPEVIRYLPGPLSVEQAQAFIAAQNAAFQQHRCCYFAAEERASGELAGFIGLRYQDFATPFAPCFELGWRLRPASWGKGLATEGARAALHYGFDTLGLAEVCAFTVPDNLRSRSVMERLGMRHDPAGDFAHPALPDTHALSRHVLYRISAGGAAS